MQVIAIKPGGDHYVGHCSQLSRIKIGNQLPDLLKIIIGRPGNCSEFSLLRKCGIQSHPKASHLPGQHKQYTIQSGEPNSWLTLSTLGSNTEPQTFFWLSFSPLCSINPATAFKAQAKIIGVGLRQPHSIRICCWMEMNLNLSSHAQQQHHNSSLQFLNMNTRVIISSH